MTETRVWCPHCARRRLFGYLGVRPDGVHELRLRCPACDVPAGPGSQFLQFAYAARSRHPDPLGGVKGYKPALNRIAVWWDLRVAECARTGGTPCPHCDGRMDGRTVVPPEFPWAHLRGWEGSYAACAACGHFFYCHPTRIALFSPEARRFWSAHPRLRVGEPRHVASAQGPLVVTRLEDAAGRAALEVVCARRTMEVVSAVPASRA
jgi:hypothetical protein